MKFFVLIQDLFFTKMRLRMKLKERKKSEGMEMFTGYIPKMVLFLRRHKHPMKDNYKLMKYANTA